METHLMTRHQTAVRCDHCRGKLGLTLQRYWHMRFCSSACVKAYRRRLAEDTKAKIHQLDFIAGDNLPARNLPTLDSHSLTGAARHLPA
jgi:hypothetical protein